MTILTNAGRAILSNRISGLGGTAPTYTGWGTGTTAEAATQPALVTPSTEARTNGTGSQATTSVTNDTYQSVATITSTQTQAITEAGLFDAVTSGNMFSRSVFAAINVNNGDSVAFTWKFTW